MPKPIRIDNKPVVKRLFIVKRIFAEWLVPLDVKDNESYDVILEKALREIEDKRILSTHPVQDYTLEEVATDGR